MPMCRVHSRYEQCDGLAALLAASSSENPAESAFDSTFPPHNMLHPTVNAISNDW